MVKKNQENPKTKVIGAKDFEHSPDIKKTNKRYRSKKYFTR